MTKWLVRQSSTTEVRFRFPGGQIAHKLSNSDLVNFLLKSNDGRDRRSSFSIFVVWSADYASAKTLEGISLSCFHEQQADHYSHVFSLIHPVDEFLFKEMGYGFSPIYHLGVNQEKWKAGAAQNSQQQCLKVFPQTFFQLKKFLDRIAFGILSNFNDGAPLGKYVEHL